MNGLGITNHPHTKKTFYTHLHLFLAKVQPGSPLLHHQAGDAFGSFASCPTHHHVHVCVPAPTDEGLEVGRAL